MADTKRKLVTIPLIENNPVILQTLGICSALAVTSSLKVSLIMCIALTSVVAFSNLSISLIRHQMPGSIRIIVQMVIIASLVIVVDQILKAFAYEDLQDPVRVRRPDHHQLHRDGPGRGLCHAEPAADELPRRHRQRARLQRDPDRRRRDPRAVRRRHAARHRDPAVGQANGGWYQPNGLLLLPPSAFFIIGGFIWILRTVKTRAARESGLQDHGRQVKEHA